MEKITQEKDQESGKVIEDLRNPEHLRAELFKKLLALPESEIQLIQQALSLAETAHTNQKRDEGDPYIVHPLRIALDIINRLSRRDAKSITIALLHDVIEDSDFTYENLRETFGEEIADAVVLLSKRRDLPKNEAFKEYYERIKKLPPDLAEIKLLDRLDNLLFLNLSPNSEKQNSYVRQTERHYLPLAENLNRALFEEIRKRIDALKTQKLSSQPSTETPQAS